MLVFRLIIESILFAWNALRSNILRTILSLLGITIGVFSVVGVLTFVDSLERNIRESFDFLGSDVIYVHKWPFVGKSSRDWWKAYLSRPYTSYNEYRLLKSKVQQASVMSIFANYNNTTAKSQSNSITSIRVTGVSSDYEKLFEKMNVERGRYLSLQEIESGSYSAVLGYEVAHALFPERAILGKHIKIKNLKFMVVGVLKKEGESFVGNTSNDYTCIIPYRAFRKMYRTGTGRSRETASLIGIRGFESDVGLVALENEVRWIMRGVRQLKPGEPDNFELNRPEALVMAIQGVFNILKIAGWIIGGFSMLVGGFGIANIMFVSVKERTGIIGLQKSLGAKNFFILFQFLFESIFLSLIGGLSGVFLVWLLTFIPFGSLQIALSFQNILLGASVSSVIGLAAGIIPALVAARLDPVIAIRAN